jgi:branched-chain amino acid transport system permease protein
MLNRIKTKLTILLRSRKFLYALIAIALIAVLPLFVGGEYIVGHVFTLMIIYALYASSWNLLAFSGQGSLGHAAFLGIGGFASALIATRLGLPPIIGLFAGGLISAGIGFLIGLTCVRLKAWFLGMVTFGFAVIAGTIISQFDDFFGGMIGFPTIPIVPQFLPFFYATLTIVAVSIGAIFWVMKSKLGLAFKTIRENELEAKMIGINTGKYKLLAFVISTFFAGLAGGLFVESQQFIQISIFEPYYSFLPLIMAVIGGLGTIEGPIIGSIIIVSIDSFAPLTYGFLQPLNPLFRGVSNAGPQLKFVGLGLFLIVVVIFLPKGITSLLRRAYDYLREDTSKPKQEKKKQKQTFVNELGVAKARNHLLNQQGEEN